MTYVHRLKRNQWTLHQSSHGVVDSAQKVNPGTLIILPKNMRQNSSDSRKAKKTDGSLTSVHVYEEQVSKYVIGVSRPVNQCGHIRAMYEDK